MWVEPPHFVPGKFACILEAMIASWFKSLSTRLNDAFTYIEIRKLTLCIIPFAAYLLIFCFYKEIRRATGLETVSKPRISILGQLEDHIFLCQPHHFVMKFANPVFDFLAAIPYLLHFPLPFFFSLFLILHPLRRRSIYYFLWYVGWVDLIASLIQLLFPMAPPWYADSAVYNDEGSLIYVFPNEAGFKRFDKLLGVSIFHSIYSKSTVTFGAFPSLHVAIPTVILLSHPWGGHKIGLIHVVWISLAALYSTHHYFIDVLGGVLLAVLVKMAIVKIWNPFPDITCDTSSGGTVFLGNTMLGILREAYCSSNSSITNSSSSSNLA